MPLSTVQRAIAGGRKLVDALTIAQGVFTSYIWDTANIRDAGVTPAKLSTDVPFRKAFTSTEQTITSGAALPPLPHLLGASPELIQVRLICKTAELGYSIGDEVIINPSDNDSAGAGRGISIVPDSTNINIRYSSNANALSVIGKTSGVVNGIINANWRLIVKAWA